LKKFVDFASVRDVVREACELAPSISRFSVLVPQFGCEDARRESGWTVITSMRLLGLTTEEAVEKAAAPVWTKIHDFFWRCPSAA